MSNSLAKIEAQAEVLNKISMRQLDRLTKYVTQPRRVEDDEKFAQLLESVKGLAGEGGKETGMAVEDRQASLEIPMLRIALQFYVGQVNYFSQSLLPDPERFASDDPFHQFVKRAVDQSSAEFRVASGWVSSVSAADVEASGLQHMYDQTKTWLAQYVKSSSEVYESRAKAGAQ